ncbi:hypothetical protein [Bremerella sp. P1]|uniref:hypothetical protein n=1 Tax=Bremerella sp. P1 TaxID=3026424 RepID=UPI00236814C7|nr:hypothetical protein [Bremerella sp. P1]WDI41838.1 hypothetical protein PSR63_25635 [Bremerella sp. P1]
MSNTRILKKPYGKPVLAERKVDIRFRFDPQYVALLNRIQQQMQMQQMQQELFDEADDVDWQREGF